MKAPKLIKSCWQSRKLCFNEYPQSTTRLPYHIQPKKKHHQSKSNHFAYFQILSHQSSHTQNTNGSMSNTHKDPSFRNKIQTDQSDARVHPTLLLHTKTKKHCIQAIQEIYIFFFYQPNQRTGINLELLVNHLLLFHPKLNNIGPKLIYRQRFFFRLHQPNKRTWINHSSGKSSASIYIQN